MGVRETQDFLHALILLSFEHPGSEHLLLKRQELRQSAYPLHVAYVAPLLVLLRVVLYVDPDGVVVRQAGLPLVIGLRVVPEGAPGLVLDCHAVESSHHLFDLMLT